jgi:hypothetical protein
MIARLRAPGWIRACLFIILGIGFSIGLDCLIRAAYGTSRFKNV